MRRPMLIGLLCLAGLGGALWFAAPMLNTSSDDTNREQALSDAELDLFHRIEQLTPEQLQRMPAKQREETIRAYATLEQKMPTVTVADAAPHGDIVAQGNVRDGDASHEASGHAAIIRLSDGALLLRLTNLSVIGGPGLHVYLTADEEGGIDRGFVDMGMLKGGKGDQNYDVPEDVEISQYRGMVIWSVPFGLPFASARL